jgi:hypothetical protein
MVRIGGSVSRKISSPTSTGEGVKEHGNCLAKLSSVILRNRLLYIFGNHAFFFIYRAEALLPARHYSSPILALQLVLSPARRFFKAFFDF